MLIQVVLGLLLRLVVLLGVAYLLYVFAEKEKGVLKNIGQTLAWALAVLVILGAVGNVGKFAHHKYYKYAHKPGFMHRDGKGQHQRMSEKDQADKDSAENN